jgi:hypothetical protein
MHIEMPLRSQMSCMDPASCMRRRRIHACHMRRRIHVCHMRRRIHACHMIRRGYMHAI